MVPSTFSRLKAARALPVILAALIFAGCGTQAPDQSAAHMQGTAQADSGFYLQQMQQSSDDSKTNWQLLAIRALLKEGKSQQASELFNQLPQKLNDTQRREQSLLAVEIKLAQKDIAGAQALLDKLTPADFDQNQQARYWQAQIDVNKGRPSLTLLRALIAQEPLLSANAKQKNIDATWQALSSMTQEQAQALVINADENVLQGWLDLQRVWFDNRNDPDMMKAGIADWQKRYPQNPGAKILPTQLVNVQSFKPASTSKIALLLPLNGQAAVFGRTIQQGFEAAKNMGTEPVAAPAVAAPAVDTTSATTTEQPQTTDGVASPSQASVSDLTNETPAQPETPAAQPTAPAQPTTTSAPANPSAELKMGVNGGSGISLTGSPVASSVPAQPGVTIGGLTIPAAPTDAQITGGSGRVDAVYILATPEEIAFIKPMIAMRNGSQSGATLYASSRSAQGTAGPDFRLEMEGLQYSEIPMLAGANAPLMQQALGAVRNDYSLARMYAMGVDAWSLANHFSQMRQVQGFEINGNTGALTATPDCVINRKLSWLKYQQGQVVPAS
ncbi:TPA: penicillin-binding protein activator [Citrobacter freundii]|nr:penicillin-binding protein activator [Citrobacter freundii]